MSLARAFIGSGDVLMNPYDPVTGLQTGWVPAGSADKFGIKPNSEIKSKKSKGRYTYGQTIATVALAGEADLAITFGEINKDNIRLAFMGRQSALNVAAGGVVVDEAFVAPALDKFKALLNANLTSAVTVKHTSGSPTYALGTDYEVNYSTGMIRPLSTGAITEGQSLKVSYTSIAVTGTRILGSTDAQLRAAFMLDGQNQVDNAPVLVNVWEGVVTPSDEFDFLADDWGQLTLTGKMTTPIGKPSPYTVDFK